MFSLPSSSHLVDVSSVDTTQISDGDCASLRRYSVQHRLLLPVSIGYACHLYSYSRPLCCATAVCLPGRKTSTKVD